LGEVKRLLTYYQDEGALKGMGDLDSQQKKLFHIELSTLQILADSNPTKQYASFLFTMNTIKGILSISSSDEPSQYKDLCAFMRSQLNLATTAAVHAAAVGGAGGPAASAASGPVIIPYIDTLQNYNQQVFAYFINELYRGLQFNPHQINFAQIKTLFSDTKIAAFSVNNPLELINELEGLLIDSNTLTSEAEKKVIEIMESLGRNIVDPARGKGRDLLTDIQRSVHQASQDKVAAAKLAESASAIAALHRVEDRSAVVVPAAAAARADDNRFIDYASSSVGQISVAAPALAGAAVVIAPGYIQASSATLSL